MPADRTDGADETPLKQVESSRSPFQITASASMTVPGRSCSSAAAARSGKRSVGMDSSARAKVTPTGPATSFGRAVIPP
jgi:hypothetical protein